MLPNHDRSARGALPFHRSQIAGQQRAGFLLQFGIVRALPSNERIALGGLEPHGLFEKILDPQMKLSTGGHSIPP